MLTAGELDAMRATSTAALPDVCEITIPSTTGTLDPETGVWTPDPPTVLYTGACRLRAPTAEEYEKVFGEQQVTETRYILTVPATVPQIPIGARCAVTSGSDPHIGQVPFRVTRVPAGSWLIDRRLGVEHVDEETP